MPWWLSDPGFQLMALGAFIMLVGTIAQLGLPVVLVGVALGAYGTRMFTTK